MTPSDDRLPRILLIGLGPTTASALEALIPQFRIVALVRDAPDHDPVVTMTRAHQVPVVRDASIASVAATIESEGPDVVVISSYDRILPEALVSQRPFLNVHYAPLPRYRGRATVNWALINGEPSVSITIHTLVPGLDAGGILFQQAIPIGARTTVTSLYDELNEVQRRALPKAVTDRLEGSRGAPQDESLATYACSRGPDDGDIDWTRPTADIDRLIRALTHPFPGAYTWLGLRRLWIDSAEPVDDAPCYEGRIAGRVVFVARGRGSVDVLTGDGVLRIETVRVDGGPAQHAAEVIRSVRQTLGLRTGQLVERMNALEAALGSQLRSETP